MARWKLTEDHYIFAKVFNEETEWEYKETDRITGRERRRRFKVPLYCNAGSVVAHEGSEQEHDNLGPGGKGIGPIVFEGKPTPSMLPIDDEAKRISAELAKSWEHPIESLPGQGFGQELLASLQKEFAAAAAKTPAPIVVAEGVSKEEFEEMKLQLAALMAKNAELEATKKAPARRSA
jgi:hypothetical protein